MKKIFLAALLFSATVLSAADFTGVYVGTAQELLAKYAVSGTPVKIGLTEAGNNVTGFFARNNVDINKFSAGSVSGNQVTVTFTEGPVTYTGTLTVSGNTISGRVTGTNNVVVVIQASKQ